MDSEYIHYMKVRSVANRSLGRLFGGLFWGAVGGETIPLPKTR